MSAGTVISNQFEGVTISAQRRGEGGADSTSENDAMIFDGANPTGRDFDLTATGDNVLIVSEDNDSSDPDDNARGGTIFFTFDVPSLIESLVVVDAEEGGTISLFDAEGVLIRVINIPTAADGGLRTIEIDVANVARMDVSIGSGGLDDLVFTPQEQTGSLSGLSLIHI